MRRLLPLLFFLLFPVMALAQEHPALDDELIYRINFGRVDDISILLDRGANPNTITDQGDTALTLALNRSDELSVPMAKALLLKGADPNMPDKHKNYPLLMVIKNQQADLVALMVAKGANFQLKAPDGKTAYEIAKATGKLELYKPMQDIIDKANAAIAAIHSPERLKGILYQYSYYSCAYQYWGYFLASRQDPSQDAKTQQRLDDNKKVLGILLGEIQQDFPATKTERLEKLSQDSAQPMYSELDALVSNRNRSEHGYGREEDVKNRCKILADKQDLSHMDEPIDYYTLPHH